LNPRSIAAVALITLFTVQAYASDGQVLTAKNGKLSTIEDPGQTDRVLTLTYDFQFQSPAIEPWY